MTQIWVLALLVSLNTAKHDVADLERLAGEIVTHCQEFPDGELVCARTIVAMAWVESRLYEVPTRRGSGCGVLQVLPRSRWRCGPRGRDPKHFTCRRPTCAELERYEIAVPEALRILTFWRRSRVCRTLRCAVRAYNGSTNRDRYVRKVWQLRAGLRKIKP